MHLHRLRGGLLGVSVLLFVMIAAAGPASADSVVYLKDGNVWIANPDGSGARQFTQYAYNWAWPSEDDNGNVVAVGGLQRNNPDGSDSSGSSEVYRFQPDGNEIGGAMPTWGSYSTPSCPTYGPRDVRVSPDGSKVAYSEFICGSEGTALWTPSDSTSLNFPNQDNVGQQDYGQPAWIDSDHFLATHVGPTFGNAQWFVHDVGGANYSGSGWTETEADGTGFQGVVNRQGMRMAVFNQDAANWSDAHPRSVKLLVYSNTTGDLTADWSDVCSVTLDATKYPDPNVISPSFSPDGSKILWADSDGVKVASVSNVAKDGSGNCTSVTPATLIPGGAEPFYGKGNVAPGAADPNQPGKPAAQPPPPTTTTPTTTTPPTTTGTPSVVKLLARFTIRTKHPRVRHKIVFDAGKSTAAKRYAWSFGDGKKGTGRRVKHAYRKAKTYKVTLTVTDAAGKHAKITHKVKVRR